MKIYVASSWRCPYQPALVKILRDQGYEVYDFRNPDTGNHGFHWFEIDLNWKTWSTFRFREALKHPIAEKGFQYDFEAMKQSDACVLLLPCGRSAHLEAGYFIGAGKPVYIFIPQDSCEPELMYKMATGVYTTLLGLLEGLKKGK